jgi:hypothetical protein
MCVWSFSTNFIRNIFHSKKNFAIYDNMYTYLLTHSMEQSPSWEANRFAASQVNTHILWNPKFLYLIHKFPPPDSILSQFNPVHTPTSRFLKIRLNIIHPSTPGSTKWLSAVLAIVN